MPRTTQCTHCGVVLNLPDQVAGKRLKCPKCGEKFSITPGDPVPKPPEESPSSSVLLTKSNSSALLPSMPNAGGDLRETFELGMMTGSAPPGKNKSGSTVPGGGKQTADALALFDSPAPAPRKKKGAEARAEARRCPECGGVVPVGMSLCQTCGLDLESGSRVDLTDDLTPPAPPKPQMPISITVLGSLCAAGGVAMAAVALVKWKDGVDGAVFFLPVALFGIYASYVFLKGKSVKPLLTALTLAAALDLAFLVAKPIYDAHADTVAIGRNPGDDPDADTQMIRPLAERLDASTLTRGLTLLSLYAVVSIYLLSPHVKRHMKH
jgi:hypothetical protein